MNPAAYILVEASGAVQAVYPSRAAAYQLPVGSTAPVDPQPMQPRLFSSATVLPLLQAASLSGSVTASMVQVIMTAQPNDTGRLLPAYLLTVPT